MLGDQSLKPIRVQPLDVMGQQLIHIYIISTSSPLKNFTQYLHANLAVSLFNIAYI